MTDPERVTTNTGLGVEKYSNVVILTGAGVSVASGLPTFRGPGGLYETHPDIAEISHADRLPEALAALWAAWGPMRRAVAAATPNAAHGAIAELARRHPGVSVVTQNVDGLHQAAGTPDVAELHGNLARSRCVAGCGTPTWADPDPPDGVPTCPGCGGPARPDMVLFGEMPDAHASWTAKRALRDVDLFIAVGTSGTVDPAARYVDSARYVGARSVLVTLDPPAGPHRFDEVIIGRAEELLPQLLA